MYSEIAKAFVIYGISSLVVSGKVIDKLYELKEKESKKFTDYKNSVLKNFRYKFIAPYAVLFTRKNFTD
ncbi:MAG: hypothetical protein J7K31_04040 [Candidatus Aenigmarchaeota archaeon]|nr:hypothetical protein [Candidatus Aenigmarchaeota archaeon]